jgi:hypothetical protein
MFLLQVTKHGFITEDDVVVAWGSTIADEDGNEFSFEEVVIMAGTVYLYGHNAEGVRYSVPAYIVCIKEV